MHRANQRNKWERKATKSKHGGSIPVPRAADKIVAALTALTATEMTIKCKAHGEIVYLFVIVIYYENISFEL